MYRKSHRATMFTATLLTLVGISLSIDAHAQSQGRVEQTDASIVYEGNWQTFADPAVTGGTIAISNQPGASATITFKRQRCHLGRLQVPLRWVSRASISMASNRRRATCSTLPISRSRPEF